MTAPHDNPGPVVLLGGGEHRRPCAAIDHWILERVGRPRPRVAVIPAASSTATLPPTAALARTYWSALGARATVVQASSTCTMQHDALAAADVVVLTGGVPGRLIAALGASPVWDIVLDRWRAGAVLSGSSAGAIALFAWRLALRVPNPLRVVPGLGPLDGHVCVPHFDRFVGRHPARRRWVQATTRRLAGLGIVGIDEATALVVDGRHLHVLGHGAVTFVDRVGWHAIRASTADKATSPRTRQPASPTDRPRETTLPRYEHPNRPTAPISTSRAELGIQTRRQASSNRYEPSEPGVEARSTSVPRGVPDVPVLRRTTDPALSPVPVVSAVVAHLDDGHVCKAGRIGGHNDATAVAIAVSSSSAITSSTAAGSRSAGLARPGRLMITATGTSASTTTAASTTTG